MSILTGLRPCRETHRRVLARREKQLHATRPGVYRFRMRKLPLLLMLLALPFPGCASDKDKYKEKKNPYEEWERKRDADEDHDFFYKGWLNPNSNDQLSDSPSGIAGPPH